MFCQVHHVELWKCMPLRVFHPQDVQTIELQLFLGKHEYFGTVARLAPLSYGALAALIALDPSCMQMIHRLEPSKSDKQQD